MTTTTIKLFCLVRGDDPRRTFTVQVTKTDTVGDLKKLVKAEKSHKLGNIDADELTLWRVNISKDDLATLTSNFDIKDDGIELSPFDEIQDIFPEGPASKHLHIVVEMPLVFTNAPSEPSFPQTGDRIIEAPQAAPQGLPSVLKRKLEGQVIPPTAPQDEGPYKRVKKFSVNGTILLEEYKSYFVLDQAEGNKPFLKHIDNNGFVSYHAPRASGKSTRMLQLVKQLENGVHMIDGFKKFECFYVDFQFVKVDNGDDAFWRSLGAAFPKQNTLPIQITNETTFCQAFLKDQPEYTDRWIRPVVLIFDEFDIMIPPEASIARISCLKTIRGIRNNRSNFVIDSIIVVGTFGVVMINQDNPSLSPFNTTENLGGNNFRKSQVEDLFGQFCSARRIDLDPRIIEDIYSRTNGHAGLVCLCGRAIDEDLKGYSGASISFESWQSFAVTKLQKKVMNHRTFERLVKNLESEEMEEAVTLLQMRFLANPEPVSVTLRREIQLSKLLAKEGALIVTDDGTFMMASSLLRAVIMKNVITKKLPCPSTGVPLRQDYSLNILEVLKTVVPLFVQHDMKIGAEFSYKVAHVKVNDSSNKRVPRESVYQQQLVGILTNWLGAITYELIGQYHTRGALGNPRYCDVVLTAPNTLGNTQPTTILELLATSTNSELNAHYERALEYAETFNIRHQQNPSTQGSSPNTRDIWVVHFTCEDDATGRDNCSWPSKEQQAKNLNAVVFWHNLDFTEIRMSACWKDKEREDMKEVYDEQIFQRG